jgi:hypothetical protein
LKDGKELACKHPEVGREFLTDSTATVRRSVNCPSGRLRTVTEINIIVYMVYRDQQSESRFDSLRVRKKKEMNLSLRHGGMFLEE